MYHVTVEVHAMILRNALMELTLMISQLQSNHAINVTSLAPYAHFLE
jgi:hypothetical protein